MSWRFWKKKVEPTAQPPRSVLGVLKERLSHIPPPAGPDDRQTVAAHVPQWFRESIDLTEFRWTDNGCLALDVLPVEGCSLLIEKYDEDSVTVRLWCQTDSLREDVCRQVGDAVRHLKPVESIGYWVAIWPREFVYLLETTIPAVLHNRLNELVQHCLDRVHGERRERYEERARASRLIERIRGDRREERALARALAGALQQKGIKGSR